MTRAFITTAISAWALFASASAANALEPWTDDHACIVCHANVVELRKASGDVHKDLSCNDCHVGRGNPHDTPDLGELQPFADKLAGKTRMRAGVLAACNKCHEKQATPWVESVHGPLTQVEVHGEQPDCLTCHGAAHQMAWSFNDKAEIVMQCSSCHGFAGEDGKPATSPYVVDTYRDTIHGRLLHLGNEKAASCTDCHSAHGVFAEADPRSTVNIKNRAQTCAQCHEGATESFAAAVSHEPPKIDHDTWAWIFTLFFSLLTFSTIALLVVHVLLDLFRSLRPHAHKHQTEDLHKASVRRDDEVQRFDIHQRIQHWGMMLSFTTLVVTGWPLKSAAVGQSSTFMDALGGAAAVGIIHRIAGGILIAVAVYHLIYLIVGIKRKTLKLSMIPGIKDARDLIGNIAFLLGLRKDRPKFGKFTYFEKFDYWAVFWGMLIMGLSGVMLWFPVAASGILPGEALELGRIAHSDEALLAALAIFLWHFYNVHLRPTIFPMSWVWLTGRISVETLYHEHREEYVRRFGDVPPVGLTAERPWHRRAAWSAIGLIAVVGIAVGVAFSDMDALSAKIEHLSEPPAAPEGTIAPAMHSKVPELPAVSRPKDPFGDCLTCHDKEAFEAGDKFPHKDHLDEYFEDEVKDAKCSMCHQPAWHSTKPVLLKVCYQCHDAGENGLPEKDDDDDADEQGVKPDDGGDDAADDNATPTAPAADDNATPTAPAADDNATPTAPAA
ncbi:MAG: hypothetical protein EP329_17835, partial [Deltaproteobacteria bacterium]